jgi:hypothetical protein
MRPVEWQAPPRAHESKRMSLLVDDMLTRSRADADVEPAEKSPPISRRGRRRGTRLRRRRLAASRSSSSGDTPVEVKGSRVAAPPSSLARERTSLLSRAEHGHRARTPPESARAAQQP